MSNMSNELDQNVAEKPRVIGSVVYCRQTPTNRVTEFMTLTFYPLFFGVVGSIVNSGLEGHFFGVGVGVVFAIIAITFRRLGARWAISNIAKRKQEVTIEDDPEKGQEERNIYPHINMMLLAETFYISMEATVLSVICSYIIYYSYSLDLDALYSSYDSASVYIDYFFSYYHGLDHELIKFVGSAFEGRLIPIKYAVLLIVISCIYSCFLMSIRLLFGWREYFEYLSAASSQLIIKNESRVLLLMAIFLAVVFLMIHSLFYEGQEYFLLMNKVPEPHWFLLTSFMDFILSIGGFVLQLCFVISLMSSYFVMLYVYLRSNYSIN